MQEVSLVEVAIPDIGIVILALGGLLVIGGLGVALWIPRQIAWFRRILMPLLEQPLPDFGLGGLVPMVQALQKVLLERTSSQLTIGAIMGGMGISAIGIIIVLLGLFIWFY